VKLQRVSPPALLVALLAAAPDPALLQKIIERQKAVQAFTDNASVVMEVRAEELASDGKVESTEVTKLRIGKKKGEPVATEVLSATEDGKDVTAQTRDEMKKEKDGKKGKSAGAQSPFHEEQVAKYRFTQLATPPDAPTHARVGFEPAGGKDAELMSGEATVDVETGDLLSLSMRPSKNPTFVDRLQIECAFDAQTPAGRAISSITAKGEGGILFIKKRFAVVSLFTEWTPTK
jgi:hypothetical protein